MGTVSTSPLTTSFATLLRTAPRALVPFFPSPGELPDDRDEELHLLSNTSLDDLIDFVRRRTIGGDRIDKVDIADPWRAAAAHARELQKLEGGLADVPQVAPLPPELQGHVEQLAALPNFQKTFSSVPVSFGMVKLEDLIVTQEKLSRRSMEPMLKLPQAPLPLDQLAASCLPLTPPEADFQVALQESRRVILTSDTHDTRFLGAQLIDPTQVKGLTVTGHPQAIVALSVGYSTNVLNVIRWGKRLVLNNGYHRAYALRARGVTHAPCLIQICAEWEEVGLAGGGAMYDNGDLYFSSPRPPMLKDFFDPKLAIVYPTRRQKREIRLSWDVDSVQLAS